MLAQSVCSPYGKVLKLTAHRKPELPFDTSLFELSWFGGEEIEASLHSLAHPLGNKSSAREDFLGGKNTTELSKSHILSCKKKRIQFPLIETLQTSTQTTKNVGVG